MKLLKKPRFSSMAVLALAMSVFVACDDNTGPAGETDPAEAAAAVQGVNASFANNEGLQSFNVLAQSFTQVFGIAPVIVPSAPGFEAMPASIRAIAGQLGAIALRESGPAAAAGPVIDAQYYGTTFIYVDGGYVASQRTGAPADGVRFILYALTPVTGEPIVDTELGYADLRDTSDASANRLQTTVVINGATLIDYVSTCSLTQSSVAVSAIGFVSDGATVVDFDLTFSVSEFDGVTIDFSVDIPSENIAIDFSVTADQFGFNADVDPFGTGAFSFDFEISQGTNAVHFTMAGTDGALSGKVEICGGADGLDCTTVANISGTLDAPIITDAGGNDLGEEGLAGIGNLFDAAGEFVGSFFGFLTPAFGLCGVAFL